ncbi:hypothetical protein Tco_0213366 [Tanacetum coccineum]
MDREVKQLKQSRSYDKVRWNSQERSRIYMEREDVFRRSNPAFYFAAESEGVNGLDPYAVVMTNHPFGFVTPSLGGKIGMVKVGTSNHEKRLDVNRNRETRIVLVLVSGFGMVSLGKVDDSMIVAVTSSCSVMGFEAQTCLQVSTDCSDWGFLVDVCWVGECFVETCF